MVHCAPVSSRALYSRGLMCQAIDFIQSSKPDCLFPPPGQRQGPLVGINKWVCVIHFLQVRIRSFHEKIRNPPTPSGELPTGDWSRTLLGEPPVFPCNSCTCSSSIVVGFPFNFLMSSPQSQKNLHSGLCFVCLLQPRSWAGQHLL